MSVFCNLILMVIRVQLLPKKINYVSLYCTVMNLSVGGGSLVWEQCCRTIQEVSRLI